MFIIIFINFLQFSLAYWLPKNVNYTVYIRVVQMKPIQRLFLVKKRKSLNSPSGLYVSHPLTNIPADGSPLQRTPWAAVGSIISLWPGWMHEHISFEQPSYMYHEYIKRNLNFINLLLIIFINLRYSLLCILEILIFIMNNLTKVHITHLCLEVSRSLKMPFAHGTLWLHWKNLQKYW